MVDNASIDGSADYVRENFPWVTVIRNEKNLGFAGGNNIGIINATGDLIALFNNDALADWKWLEELVNTILISSKIGVVGGKIYQNKSSQIWFSGSNFFPCSCKPWLFVNDHKKVNAIKNVDVVSGCAMMFRREVIEKIGLLDEGYFFYFEDTDFCLQAKRAGFKLLYNGNAIVWHEGGATIKRVGLKKRYIEYQSKFRFILKNLPFFQIVAALILHTFFVTIYNICVLRQEAPIEKFKAFFGQLAI